MESNHCNTLYVVIIVGFLSTHFESNVSACVTKQYQESFVCVCNSTYCDVPVKVDKLASGRYVTVTSSKTGLRFFRKEGNVVTDAVQKSDQDGVVIKVDTQMVYQKILGFGGSITDAVGINVLKLSAATQQNLIKSYFGSDGLGYNLMRIPIGGSDFSTHAYGYNELPVNDGKLSNFSLTVEDYKYKIPLIKRAKSLAEDDILIIASIWSPPPWMKTGSSYSGFGSLKKKYYQTLAHYHLRFLEEYVKNDVKIWAVTTGNEPTNGFIPGFPFNAMAWSPMDQAVWVCENLGPTIKKSRVNNTLILAHDNQRYTLPYWLDLMSLRRADWQQWVDGVALHAYGNFAPTALLRKTRQRYPNLMIISTEACEGYQFWEKDKVILGSWRRAENYAINIIDASSKSTLTGTWIDEKNGDLSNDIVGWIDWNLALDQTGGPNWAKNFVDAPIIINHDKDEFYKQPMYYIMGHFAKYVLRGSKRVKVAVEKSDVDIMSIGFLRPDNYVVIVLFNRSNQHTKVKILDKRKKSFYTELPAKSIQTAIYAE